jgi:hypothetical protein
MPSSGMLRRVALVGADVLEEHSISVIRVTKIGFCHADDGGARFPRNTQKTAFFSN